MSKQVVRIRLKAYDHRILDNACTKKKFTILRAVHKYKDSREQFEMRTHKRLIDIKNPSKEIIDALSHLDLPSGVDIDIKQCK